MRRTIETVSGFLTDGIDHTPLAGLDEIHWGSKEGKPFDARDHHEYKEVTEQWSKGHTHLSIAGGESPNDVKIRQKESLDHIMGNNSEQTIFDMYAWSGYQNIYVFIA